ncbi:MAG: electron transfer flavoprotein subunit alpha/FixB family protein, partial [Deltaproteobacteria bacterium]|nr:electron transfer flavoprotein subunit alpha/FixB family protein [Deltaproteobacteria bacterium]
MGKKIVVIAELTEGRLAPATLEVVSFARMLRGADPAEPHVIAAGKGTASIAEELALQSGLDVTALEGDGLDPYNAEAFKGALVPLLDAWKPEYICLPHTARGCDLAPGFAIALGAGCITAVEGIRKVEGSVGFLRSLFKGKVVMEAASETETTVLTVLPGAFKMMDAPTKRKGAVEFLLTDCAPRRTRPLGLVAAAAEQLNLSEAEIIVSAGKGIGSEENLDLIRRLAALFPKAAIGGSRLVCDLGWLGYQHQIGITGKTVSPRLYIACGISGAIQHTSGMQGSHCIVAINKDPHAAIFRIADYAIVEDLTTFIPLLI